MNHFLLILLTAHTILTADRSTSLEHNSSLALVEGSRERSVQMEPSHRTLLESNSTDHISTSLPTRYPTDNPTKRPTKEESAGSIDKHIFQRFGLPLLIIVGQF